MRTEDPIAARALRAGDEHYRAYVGPPHQYDFMGATQFRLLTALGLREEHHLLDIGCGSLRAGRLLIPYLLPGRYCGIEPNGWLVDDAVASELGADLIRLKAPRFSTSETFDYASFGTAFDFIVAQSIFSHTGRAMAQAALANMPAVMHDASVALVTFVEAGAEGEDDLSPGWVYPGILRYHHATVMEIVKAAGLAGQRLPWFHPRQTWYLLARQPRTLLTRAELGVLDGSVLRDPRFTRP